MTDKKIKKGARQLKVVSKYQPRDYHQYAIVPEIRLCGKWLKESGFEEGMYVNIEVQNNRLIITLNEEKPITDAKPNRLT
ncbi:MAG: SymE family type I addiction module toxin [Reichenbachiella sp.]|uniref:SymE family type I addiction module toxin n=1 Tax=Reichenbachiella sp. TaxID=2184521 RepID=UPI0032662E20